MAAVGFFLLILGVSTSDYYILELEQIEPASVWVTIVIGFMLMIPALIHCIREELKREDQ